MAKEEAVKRALDFVAGLSKNELDSLIASGNVPKELKLMFRGISNRNFLESNPGEHWTTDRDTASFFTDIGNTFAAKPRTILTAFAPKSSMITDKEAKKQIFAARDMRKGEDQVFLQPKAPIYLAKKDTVVKTDTGPKITYTQEMADNPLISDSNLNIGDTFRINPDVRYRTISRIYNPLKKLIIPETPSVNIQLHPSDFGYEATPLDDFLYKNKAFLAYNPGLIDTMMKLNRIERFPSFFDLFVTAARLNKNEIPLRRIESALYINNPELANLNVTKDMLHNLDYSLKQLANRYGVIE